jgi:predicted Zn-dependent protease
MSPNSEPVDPGAIRAGRGRVILLAAGLMVALAIGAGLVSQFVSEAQSSSMGRLAREALAARRYDQARTLIRRWAAESPRSGEPDYYQAVLEVEADRPAEALDAMRRSIARGYPEEPVLILRAVLLARAGQFEQAEPVLTRAFLSGAEPRAEVAEGLSRIYLKTFRLAETTKVLDSWMKAAPDDPRPYLLRNEVDQRINSEPAVLIRNYREALRRDPGLIVARLGLAEKLRETALVEEAETEYAALLGRDPKNVRGLVGAGQIALLQGDLVAATRHLEDALAIDPRDKVALREIGLIDMNSGRTARACDRFAAAVEVDPYDPEIRYSYSRALQMSGKTARAAEESAATERLKKEQQRIADLRQRLVQRPEDVELRSEAARWLIEHGHDKEGLEWTALILRQQPGHPSTCRLLADYYASRGNLGLANYYRLTATETPATK